MNTPYLIPYGVCGRCGASEEDHTEDGRGNPHVVCPDGDGEYERRERPE